MAIHLSILNISKYFLLINYSSKLISSSLATKNSFNSLYFSKIFQTRVIKNLIFAQITNKLRQNEIAFTAIFYS